MLCPSCKSELTPGVGFCPECGMRLAQGEPLSVLQGRYELIRKLGQGGMGAVYLAADRRLSTARWAVKELSDEQITTPLERQQAAESFRQEAELLAALAHPNLPRVTDSFSEQGRNYLVMEFVPGETLQAYIQRSGLPRPLSEVRAWAEQLCEVLAYLHGREPPVIFRDLKPANVMLTPDGSLKLIDFGIARHFKPGQAQDTLAFGTVGYSAPEQYGRGQTDARSDIYSLSVLLHYALTGYDPANTPFRIPAALQLNPSLPPALSAALAQGMHNDPGQRFETIAAFRQALLGSGNLVQTQSVEAVASLTAGPPDLLAASAEAGLTAGRTTGLALAAMVMGLGSAVMMALGAALVAAGAATGDPESTLIGLGAVLSLLPGVLGPTATALGFVALFNKATQATQRGRRDAIIAICAGLLTLLLCCSLIAVFPSQPTEGHRPEPNMSGRLTQALSRGWPVAARSPKELSRYG